MIYLQIEYFSFTREEGLKLLKKATHHGHAAATYALGIILFNEDSFVVQGMEHLRMLSKAKEKDGRIVDNCRKRMKKILSYVWMINRFQLQREHRCFDPNCHNQPKRKLQKLELWSFDLGEEQDKFCSEMCRWTYEIYIFFRQC